VLIDVHFHPTDFPPSRDLGQMLDRARSAGIRGAIATGYDPTSCQAVLTLARNQPGLLAAVGYHPWFLHPDLDLTLVRTLANSPFVVAIGEIGMDGKCETPLELQEHWFRAQLELAAQLDLPAIIHSRSAVAQVLRVLPDYPSVRAIMHSFPGAGDAARSFLALGAYFSLSGSVTRANARKALSLMDCLPLDRILLETDAPAIAIEGIPPADVEISHILSIGDRVAQRKSVPLQLLLDHVAQNAEALFGLRLQNLDSVQQTL